MDTNKDDETTVVSSEEPEPTSSAKLPQGASAPQEDAPQEAAQSEVPPQAKTPTKEAAPTQDAAQSEEVPPDEVPTQESNAPVSDARKMLALLPGFDTDEEPDAGAQDASKTDEASAQTADTPLSQTLAGEPIAQGEGVRAVSLGAHIATGSDTTEARSGTAKHVLIGLACVIAALGLVYGGVGLYFTSHFLPNTTVNGDEVSGMSVEDLSRYVTDLGSRYETRISGDGIDLTIPGSEIGVTYDGAAYGAKAASQIPAWSWPTELQSEHTYTVDQGISFDEAKLQELVGAAVDQANQDSQPPTNATMAYDEASKSFVVVSDQLGTAIDRDAAIAAAAQGVGMLQEEIVLGDEQLVQPAVRKDDERLAATIDKANGLLQNSIVLRIANTDVKSIEGDQLSSWLAADADCNLAVNAEAIKAWAQGPLSDELDTVGKVRTYTRADGKQVSVEESGGDTRYGWCLNSDELTDILTQRLQSASSDPIDIPMRSSAASWNPGGQDWPSRYLDVDLAEQHVRLYDESSNVIWESDCVSGSPQYGGTDTGVYYVYEKDSPMELVGLDYNHDGQPDYRTWVTYWMPFDGGTGLHDMSSRSAFGGNIYTYNGSHACINLPYSKAQELFGIINVGEVVVVHN